MPFTFCAPNRLYMSGWSKTTTSAVRVLAQVTAARASTGSARATSAAPYTNSEPPEWAALRSQA